MESRWKFTALDLARCDEAALPADASPKDRCLARKLMKDLRDRSRLPDLTLTRRVALCHQILGLLAAASRPLSSRNLVALLSPDALALLPGDLPHQRAGEVTRLIDCMRNAGVPVVCELPEKGGTCRFSLRHRV